MRSSGLDTALYKNCLYILLCVSETHEADNVAVLPVGPQSLRKQGRLLRAVRVRLPCGQGHERELSLSSQSGC